MRVRCVCTNSNLFNEIFKFGPSDTSVPIFGLNQKGSSTAKMRTAGSLSLSFTTAFQKHSGEVTETTSIFFYSLWCALRNIIIGVFRMLVMQTLLGQMQK